MVTPRKAGADPNNANCKPNRATCTSKRQCCSGFCGTDGLCAAPPTTTTTTSTSATTTSTTSTTTTSTTSTTLRFVDNMDGTVTDNETGLQWEKKVAGSGCLHCVDDTYTCMLVRWIAAGLREGGRSFRRLRGHRDLAALIRALDRLAMDSRKEVA